MDQHFNLKIKRKIVGLNPSQPLFSISSPVLLPALERLIATGFRTCDSKVPHRLQDVLVMFSSKTHVLLVADPTSAEIALIHETGWGAA
ncbi:hypothetical protein PoB_005629800 [Plakobranchus ocellatus]|uniref:Uncharacterized protein n=1 Tax=Plakobranchus ocellatus TaxID=259542 RepID=A0AAV4CE99_9GAST|nr:hypothetical protein PoB_005629800 [Plakobranchus ocellatus]